MASFTGTESRAIQGLSDGQISFNLPAEDIVFNTMQALSWTAGVFPFANFPNTPSPGGNAWSVFIVRPGDPVGSFAAHIIRSPH